MRKQIPADDLSMTHQISFQTFGVKVSISAGRKKYLEKISGELLKIFPGDFEYIEEKDVDYRFYIDSKKDGEYELYRNDERLLTGLSEGNFYENIESKLRVTVAEFAVSKVFLHAGVVGWRDKAIVIPADSFAGKTTLVAELVKLGALYYSDEFAVLDAEGNVEPFPKMLSLRGIIDDYRQVDYPVEALGGIAGDKTIPVKMVLITEYDAKNAEINLSDKLKPEILSRGQGIMEILHHTLPLRVKPEFTFQVLNKMATHAIIVRIVRGDAKDFARKLLNYFDSQDD